MGSLVSLRGEHVKDRAGYGIVYAISVNVAYVFWSDGKTTGYHRVGLVKSINDRGSSWKMEST